MQAGTSTATRSDVAKGRADAESVARYVLEGVRSLAGSRYRQGPRYPLLALSSEIPELCELIQHQIYKLPARAVLALSRVEHGYPFEVRRQRLNDDELVRLQRRGARAVTLLAADESAEPYSSGLEFAIHDLCHFERFTDPSHYVEQIGFFSAMGSALERAPFVLAERALDAEWERGKLHVLADMNGSSLFLFAVLKMKLKMAARRALARERGYEPKAQGPLDADELERFQVLERALFDSLEWSASMRDAGHAMSARRDSPTAGSVLHQFFEAHGRLTLEESGAGRRLVAQS
jgi:hypothetical protein